MTLDADAGRAGAIITFHQRSEPDPDRRTRSAWVLPRKFKLPPLTMVGMRAGSLFVTVSNVDARDGTEVPMGLLFNEAGPDDAAAPNGVWVAGTFDAEEVGLGRGWTIETATAALAKVGITLRPKVPTHTVHRV